MNHHRITGALAALVVSVALVSCAADAEPPSSGAREGKGKATTQERGDRKAVDRRGGAGPGQEKPVKGRDRAGGSGPAAPEPSAGSTGAGGATPGSTGSTNDGPAARPSCTEDPTGDLESSGDAPSYADLTGGCLQADGTRLRLEARTAAAVPARMPDRDTQLAYGFELTTPSGSTTYVHAQASPEGWSAYVSRGDRRREIAAPQVEGSRVVVSLPFAELGGADRLQWVLEASWLQSGLLDTAYAFDSAPNGGSVRFDR